MQGLEVKASGDGVRVSVRVKPRASKNRVVGVKQGALEVAVTAPPVDGLANAALVEFLAELVDRPRSSVRVVSGETARTKILNFAGLDEASLRSRLAVGS